MEWCCDGSSASLDNNLIVGSITLKNHFILEIITVAKTDERRLALTKFVSSNSHTLTHFALETYCQ